VNRVKRPNTWLQRPMLQNREESSCQTGAVHTWHIASFRAVQQPGRFGSKADINFDASCSAFLGTPP
jgi:hypothetical protein